MTETSFQLQCFTCPTVNKASSGRPQECNWHRVCKPNLVLPNTSSIHNPKSRFPALQLTGIIVDEILSGADGTNIKCGVVGEIGCSWPLTESERRVLQAAAQAQAQLRCPVTIHPGRSSEAPFQIIRLLQEAGAKAAKTVMCHLDR